MKQRTQFSFILFVAGDAPNSARAIANLGAFCRKYLAGRYSIEIVDVFLEPKRALAQHIFMTPTLVTLSPLPSRRIVGTLSQVQPLLQTFGLLDTTET
ncbi:circadian clock KaiB family protein [Zwartia sp.]|uniref:circadian clock KaiB family protein n=1 Tax=Zwartia sp. TaxID=2978004 RepID=UPI002723BC7C|nr:circadian clock KaiB family protein [Zwartia sp.]MDO9024191.1 circadian clock KaiB family protein [Zwartia sp.]